MSRVVPQFPPQVADVDVHRPGGLGMCSTGGAEQRFPVQWHATRTHERDEEPQLRGCQTALAGPPGRRLAGPAGRAVTGARSVRPGSVHVYNRVSGSITSRPPANERGSAGGSTRTVPLRRRMA